MSRAGDDYEKGAKGHSGWLIPMAVFLMTAALSALVLLYYLAPAPTSFIGERPAPTSGTAPVALTVGGLTFTVPANYLVYRSTRQGGEREEVALFAALPDLRGYRESDAHSFTGNPQDSPVIYMLIREEPVNLTEAEKLQRIYLAYVGNPKGEPGPFGLTQYAFRDDSGYRGEDLLVGHLDGRLVVLRCVRLSERVPSPSCLRDLRLAKHVGLSYRFKRAQLSRWREIAAGVDRLIRSFETKS
jgi:hypothetical protein